MSGSAVVVTYELGPNTLVALKSMVSDIEAAIYSTGEDMKKCAEDIVRELTYCHTSSEITPELESDISRIATNMDLISKTLYAFEGITAIADSIDEVTQAITIANTKRRKIE